MRPVAETGAEISAETGAGNGSEFRYNTESLLLTRYRQDTDDIYVSVTEIQTSSRLNTNIVKHDTVHMRIKYIHIQTNTCTF